MKIEAIGAMALVIYLLSELAVWVLGRFIKVANREKYQDFLFEAIDDLALPAGARKYFERFTPEFERLGFRPVGDYLLLKGTTRAVSRFFISPDGGAVAGIDDWRWLLLRTRTYSLMSVFDDGTYLESAPMQAPADRLSKSTHLRLHYCPGASVEELYERHQQAVGEHAERHGAEVLAVSGEEFKQVVNYGHRLLHHAMYAKGLVPEPPPLESEGTLVAAAGK